MGMRGLRPLPCAIDACDAIGAAIVERYDPVDDQPGTAEPSGDWEWLCADHAVDVFA